MKKDKKRHRKKSYSFRRKKIGTQTSSSVSSEATCYMVLSPSEQHNRHCDTVYCVSVPSNSRSSFVRKKATRSDFLSALELRPEEKLKSIAFYIDNREEMVRHMFASLQRKELYDFLPENLKELEEAELRNLCLKELSGMSKKNIYTILKGRDLRKAVNLKERRTRHLSMPVLKYVHFKTSKTEIAVADSTTEMTAPNLPCIFHSIGTGDAITCSSVVSTSEAQCTAVENISSTRIRQETGTAVQFDFTMEDRILLSSNQHAEIFASKDVSDLNDQAVATITPENDDDLEDGEVVSDQGKSSNSSKDDTLNKDQNCSQHLPIYCHRLTDSADDDLSSSLIPKNSGIRVFAKESASGSCLTGFCNPCSSGNSTDATNKVREERKLHILELELRARAIEALIRRSDNKP
ncbi:hypothetical protein LOAG_16999 [Loa loa]|uniref:Uncharacterized protein n=1 Tax=Loa loa TaxID=7209 RepID=A0A1S0UMA3_LOALO|nr:hypothetical protein LOAG_16999 [Loa loa]EJD75967.1 hypothetical protein LOAG_16999 [Loa loa]